MYGSREVAVEEPEDSIRLVLAGWGTSVVNKYCRVHDLENLYIADGSVLVNNGGFNPVLTIMALAFRTGEHIVKQWMEGGEA